MNTFGALLRFALELEERAAALYRQAARAARDARLKTALEGLAREGERHRQRLERERRENINEMLLESVHGMRADDYRLELQPSLEARDPELLQMARRSEEILERFYLDAASRLSVPEVARSLVRLAEAHKNHRVRLNELQTAG